MRSSDTGCFDATIGSVTRLDMRSTEPPSSSCLTARVINCFSVRPSSEHTARAFLNNLSGRSTLVRTRALRNIYALHRLPVCRDPRSGPKESRTSQARRGCQPRGVRKKDTGLRREPCSPFQSFRRHVSATLSRTLCKDARRSVAHIAGSISSMLA